MRRRKSLVMWSIMACVMLLLSTVVTSPTPAKNRRKGNSPAPPRRMGGAEPLPAAPCTESTQQDLSGTYTGILTYNGPDAQGTPITIDGKPATLVVTGNQFTLTPEGTGPIQGRITAVTSCGYTGVTMMFGDLTPPPSNTSPPPNPAFFIRACLRGDNLRLTSKDVSGGSPRFIFQQGGAALGGRNSWGRCRGSYT